MKAGPISAKEDVSVSELVNSEAFDEAVVSFAPVDLAVEEEVSQSTKSYPAVALNTCTYEGVRESFGGRQWGNVL